jgi:spore coat polysaccharide biosynthesis protein SpsF
MFQTEQEQFWATDFGNEYVNRNKGAHIIASNLALFAKILARTQSINSIIEFGANIGLNLSALNLLLPQAQLAAIEINQAAVTELQANLPQVQLHHQSILDFVPAQQFDLVLIKGVLIHINPDKLPQVYDLLYQSSQQYLCISEYYNPAPVAIPYRGHEDKLFKRDFAGEMLDRYPDLQLVDYGFNYHRDLHFPQDDTTWFLLKKVNG